MIRLCGNCFFFHYFTLPTDGWELARNSGDCECVECRHRANFNAAGKIGHFAPSNAQTKDAIARGLAVGIKGWRSRAR